jgi:long-chain fatty acid transport protein
MLTAGNAWNTETTPSEPGPIGIQAPRTAGRLRLLGAGLWIYSTLAAAGSGFELRSQSGSTLGTAQAGMTAGAQDAASLVFNPASLSYGTGKDYVLGLTVIGSHTTFELQQATTAVGVPLADVSGGNAGSVAGIPNQYVAVDVRDGVRVGLGITSRFGLGSSWNDNWSGRYYAGTSKLATLDLIPAVSFSLGPSVKIGAAIDAEYARAQSTTAIDIGTIDTVLFNGVFGGVPARSDATLRTNLRGWAFGLLVGGIVEPQAGTRIGLSYRSKLRQSLRGQADFDSNTSPVWQALSTATGVFTDSDAHLNLRLPASVLLGVFSQLDARWAIMADVQWTQWSALQTLELQFANPLQATAVTELRWRDSWFVTAGAQYHFSDHWLGRFGVAVDQTPTRYSTSTPQIPEANSLWIGCGVRYTITASTSLDLAYGHIFVRDQPVNLLATTPGNLFRGNLSGTLTENRVDYVAIQLDTKF